MQRQAPAASCSSSPPALTLPRGASPPLPQEGPCWQGDACLPHPSSPRWPRAARAFLTGLSSPREPAGARACSDAWAATCAQQFQCHAAHGAALRLLTSTGLASSPRCFSPRARNLCHSFSLPSLTARTLPTF